MAEIEIKIESHKDEAIEETMHKMLQGLLGCGEAAEGFAKENCPVDTGRLRDSITFEVDDAESAMYVGTNVEYAMYVEFRDVNHQTGQAHFLRDSLANHENAYKTILEGALS